MACVSLELNREQFFPGTALCCCTSGSKDIPLDELCKDVGKEGD